MTARRSVVLLDYGMCNMLNVARAFEAVGARVDVVTDARMAKDAERLVLPGVGAFPECMRAMTSLGFAEAVHTFVATGRPMLGICVGMQVLFESSDEFGVTPGLGILAGHVRAVPSVTLDGRPQRIPHVGYEQLVPATKPWAATPLTAFSEPPWMYFLHSFAAIAADAVRVADCVYGGQRLAAMVQQDNITAVQFHPERSGPAGLRFLRGFLER